MKTIKTINNLVGDYKPGDLVLVHGKTGSGKTNYLIFEAINAALNKNKVLFCHSEFDAQYIIKKIEAGMEPNKEKNKSIFGMGIYENAKRKKKVDILIRNFESDKEFLSRLRNFIIILESKNKKPDVIFIDCFELLNSERNIENGSVKSTKNGLIKLKEIAKEMGVVIFAGMQSIATFNCDYDELSEEFKQLSDFVFYVENKGLHEISKKNIFEITISKIRDKYCKLTLKCSFDFNKMDLSFLEYNYDYDNTMHDISTQFKELSFVLSPESERRNMLMLNLAEMYSKQGKNVLIMYKSLPTIDCVEKIFGKTESKKMDGKFLAYEENFGKKYFALELPMPNKIIQYFNDNIETIKSMDYIIIDDLDEYCDKNDYASISFLFENIKKFSCLKNICIISGSNINSMKNLKENENETYEFSRTKTKGLLASFVLGLKNYTPKGFRKIAKANYNTILFILKDRTGDKRGRFLTKIDDDKLKIKIIRNLL